VYRRPVVPIRIIRSIQEAKCPEIGVVYDATNVVEKQGSVRFSSEAAPSDGSRLSQACRLTWSTHPLTLLLSLW